MRKRIKIVNLAGDEGGSRRVGPTSAVGVEADLAVLGNPQNPTERGTPRFSWPSMLAALKLADVVGVEGSLARIRDSEMSVDGVRQLLPRHWTARARRR